MTLQFTTTEFRYKFLPVNSRQFEFQVAAQHTVYVALSPVPSKSPTIFEILIGCIGNTTSAIRKNNTRPDVLVVPTVGILSETAFRGFWIRWYDDIINVGRQGEKIAFMSYNTHGMFPVNFIGFCTTEGSTATWTMKDDSVPVLPDMNDPRDDVGCTVPYKSQGLSGSNGAVNNVCRTGSCENSNKGNDGYPVPPISVQTNSSNNLVSDSDDRHKRSIPESPPNDQMISPNDQEESHDGGRDGNSLPVPPPNGQLIFPDNSEKSPGSVGNAGGQADMPKLRISNDFTYIFIPLCDRKLNITVQSAYDIRIGLSSSNYLSGDTYEIDCWKSNKYVRSENTNDQAKQVRNFWINFNIDAINIGVQGETAPFMSLKSEIFLSANYIGVCTAWGRGATWEGNVKDPNICVWVPATSGQVPPKATKAGVFNNEQLYIARARHVGDLIPGKLSPSHGVCYVVYDGNVYAHREYEVMCTVNPCQWITVSDGKLPLKAYPVGETAQGVPIFIGRVTSNNSNWIGKVQQSDGCCYISYGGAVLLYKQFEVLATF